MSAKFMALSVCLLFAAGFVALMTVGRGFLRQMSMADTTVCYLDLARQASARKDYATAHEMYKQALTYARLNDPTGQAESAMLRGYAKFAWEKLKDKQLADELQARGMQLRKAEATRKLAAGRTP